MALSSERGGDPKATHDKPFRLDVVGYCGLTRQELLARFVEGRADEVARLPGEYTLVFERGEDVCIVSSPYGVTQYYYALVRGRFFHGGTVLDVARRAELPWAWNWRALACLTQLQHLVEDDTLHAHVLRVPPRSILWFRNGRLTRQTTDWDDIHQGARGDPGAALEAFNREVGRWAHGACAISMSGGFDTRVILSSLLRLGAAPTLVVMGTERSTDRQIVTAIAKRLDLRLVPVEIEERDFLPAGPLAVQLTSGTKTADHWHSLIGPTKASLPTPARVFVGSNGECARSYYLDKGALSRAVDLGPMLLLRLFWLRKAKSIFTPQEAQGLNPALAAEVAGPGRARSIQRLAHLCETSEAGLLAGLDRFYTDQRVRHFIGNGLRLHGASWNWVAPFLSHEWVREVRRMPRRWKLGSNWHRYAIRRNFPALLDFPEEGVAERMAPATRAGYWLARRHSITGYSPVAPFLRTREALAAVADRRHAVSEVISERALLRVIEDQEAHGTRNLAVAFLLAFGIYAEQVRTP